MGSLNASFENRLVPATLCASVTILVYDLMCTFDQEVQYVWSRPWSTSTALFVLNRYLPFFDTFLGLSAKFTRLSPQECLMRNVAVAWLSVLGIMLSEVILMLRTYAIWERKRSVLIFLSLLAFCAFISIAFFVRLETHSLQYVATNVGSVGCSLAKAGNVLIFGYLMVMISETAIAVLTAIKAYRDLRRSRVPWVVKLYQDGMLFYVYLLAVSVANVVVPLTAPPMFANWLATPQRVLHSVLCTRVLLLILRARRISDIRRSGTPSESGEASGMVFSSVVDGSTAAASDLALTMLDSSSSRREVYTYPMSPGTDEEEEEGRPRFKWPL